MYLKLNDVELSCPPGTLWRDAVAMLPEPVSGALGVSAAGHTDSMWDPVREYVRARLLTRRDEEGRRIYERSLILLFLTAVRKLYPDARARIEHSFGQGLYIVLENPSATEPVLQAIDGAMRALVARDLPYRKHRVSTREAADYFGRTGQTDRLRLLQYRAVDHFLLYAIDGYEDYLYGEMAPSTGCIGTFSLKKYAGGLVLMQPDAADPGRPAPFKDLPGLMDVYTRTARWHQILGCANAADLNAMIDSGRLRDFIRVSEALQARSIDEIAAKFLDSGARLILIAGPSSSGKTTFASRLDIALRVSGLRPVKLSLDDYYRNRDELPREKDGSIDLERLDTLDTALLCEHLPRLIAGETVEIPRFDFKTGRRAGKTHPMRVEAGQPIIIEGIHGLNDALTASVPASEKFKIYISALTMLNLDDHNRIRTTDARLLRRIVRDNRFRGTPPEETMAMWPSVRRGEEKYIFPFQERADAMFNSSLAYELPIMKAHAYNHLRAVQPESPHYTLARRLIKFLNYIHTADVEDEIPANSLLREFIGGSCF